MSLALLFALGCVGRAETLKRLRADRQWLRESAVADAPLEAGGGYSVRALVGLSRNEVTQALGAPDRKVGIGSENYDYDFHRLPPGWLGGGKVLWLEFSDDGRCRSAGWAVIQ